MNNPIQSSRRPRRAWRWTLTALALALPLAVTGWVLRPDMTSTVARSLGDSLHYQALDQLPDWADQPLQRYVEDPHYQLVAAQADLNQDGQIELLIAPAPRVADVFIPDTPLRLITRQPDGDWQLIDTGLSCRPVALGSFLANGYWDLPCRTRSAKVVLRWSGSRYFTDS